MIKSKVDWIDKGNAYHSLDIDRFSLMDLKLLKDGNLVEYIAFFIL